MATLKPRITCTLNPFTHGVIEEFARLQNRSRGAVVADLLESVAPALSETVALLAAAQEAPEGVKRNLAKTIRTLQADLDAATTGVSAQLHALRSYGQPDRTEELLEDRPFRSMFDLPQPTPEDLALNTANLKPTSWEALSPELRKMYEDGGVNRERFEFIQSAGLGGS